MKQRNPSKKIWELNIHQTSGTSPKVNPTNVFTLSFNKHWSHVHFMPDPGMMVGTQKVHARSLSSWDSQSSAGDRELQQSVVNPGEAAPGNFPKERWATGLECQKGIYATP